MGKLTANMISSIEQAKLKVADWVQSHRSTVLYDEEGSTLLDVASGKRVSLPSSASEASGTTLLGFGRRVGESHLTK